MATLNLSTKQRKELLDKINAAMAEGNAHCHTHHTRADEDQQYIYGNTQWSKTDKARQQRRKRPAVPVNDCFKVVSSIANRETVERLAPKILPRESEDNGIATLGDEICRWQRQMAQSEHYESQAFFQAVASGIGVIHLYWDATANDGRGQIRTEDVPIHECYWPARAREMSMTDRRWWMRGRWVNLDEAEAAFGLSSSRMRKKFKQLRTRSMTARASADMSALGEGAGTQIVGTPGFGWQMVKAGDWVNSAAEEVFVVEFEWREIEYAYRAVVPNRWAEWYAFEVGRVPIRMPPPVDPSTGEPMMDPATQQPMPETEITYDQYTAASLDEQNRFRAQILQDAEAIIMDPEDLDILMGQWEEIMGGEFTDFEKVGKTVIRYAIKIDDEIAEYGTRDWGWSYYVVTCFRHETSDGVEWVGVTSLIKGPQDLKNSILSNLMAMYAHSPKGGYIVAKSLGAHAQRMADEMNTPGSFVVVPDDVLQNFDDKMRQMPAPVYPQLSEPLLNIFNDAVLNAVGLDPLSVGAQTDLRRVSGVVAQSARLASNTVVAQPFDSLRMTRRQLGLANLKFLYRQYPLQEIIRIVGKDKLEGLENIDWSRWGDVVNFDIVIDEAPMSPTEKDEWFERMTTTGLLATLWQGGVFTNEDVVEMLPGLAESQKRKILKNQKLSEQLQQAMAMIQQLQQGAPPGGAEQMGAETGAVQ